MHTQRTHVHRLVKPKPVLYVTVEVIHVYLHAYHIIIHTHTHTHTHTCGSDCSIVVHKQCHFKVDGQCSGTQLQNMNL
jgi:hypothetical protein